MVLSYYPTQFNVAELDNTFYKSNHDLKVSRCAQISVLASFMLLRLEGL
jgi:uncharacterized protein YecE (DUF72 family)